MKNLLKITLLSSMIFYFGCGDLEQINIDPTRPEEIALNLMLPDALSQTFFNQGTNSARVAGIIMQQFEGFDAQQVAYTDYVLPDVTFNNYWSTGLYGGALRSAQLMVDQAGTEGAPHYAGIGKIILAANYGDAASYFGDIPFSEALKGLENFKPAYDTQEAVYAGVQSLLDEAIGDLGQPVGGTPTVGDLIFGGDAEAWIKTAYALKARYLMQTIKRNPGAASTILDLVQNKAFQSAGEEPSLTWSDSEDGNNPLAKFGLERPNTLVISNNFADILQSTNDPRFEIFIAPEEDDVDAPTDTLYWQFHSIKPKFDGRLYWSQNDSRVPLITVEELKLIEAELQLAGGDAAAAKASMVEAVNASFAHVGAEDTDGAYIAALEERFDNASDPLEVLIGEAYVSYYGHAFHQSWVNYRRTGYPNITPSANGNNGLNPGGGIPRRYIYPLTESETNNDNLQAAISRQGGALLNQDVWAFE